MKFGSTSASLKGYENAKYLKEAGYDYIELCLSVVNGMDKETFKDCKIKLQNLNLKSEAMNGFCSPSDAYLVGVNRDLKKLKNYTEKAFERASELGTEIVVLGSGEARKVPQGYSFENALKEFKESAFCITEIAKKYGITVVLEPLNYKACNLLNTVKEGNEICNELNHPNLKLLADLLHMVYNKENYADIIDIKENLFHIHINNPAYTSFPAIDDGFDYLKFIEAVKAAGYNRRISVEACTTDFEKDSLKSMELIKKIKEVL